MFRGFQSSLALLLLATVALIAAAQDEADFVPVNGTVSQMANQLQLPSTCSQSGQEVPSVMYTVRPGDAVSVSTYPAYLLAASGTDSLQLSWNLDAAVGVQEAGVLIEFPAAQLAALDICCSARAQIQSGFTSIQSFTVSTSGQVSADFSTVTASEGLKLDVSTSATASIALDAGNPPRNADVSTSAVLTTSGGNLATIDASTECSVKIAGGGVAGGAISTLATLEQTEPCQGLEVDTGGRCTQDSALSITVDTNQPLTVQGRQECVQSSNGFTIDNGKSKLVRTMVWLVMTTIATPFLAF
jgi:hypothetical protein